ncbi:MAG: undecaprenyldiphospho-muramoylpentapeptide beta-N-acetylglucosaminyltransferase [Helicobacteraceae bacterium]|nr:undecaprenyldiphospho-muramoylpentapeptide beta-N-acetylglucosaminyltransferase [Helicobacteraceae bacterium]
MIVITGGGTGGHLAAAKAVKNALNEEGIKPFFIGSSGGQDQAWFENEIGFADTRFLSSAGVMNRRGIFRLFALIDIVVLAFKTRKLLREIGATAVFSVGGYSAAPAALAAVGLKIPLVIHEQNAVYGSLNRLLKPFAKEVFCSFDPNSPSRDYPVDDRFFETARQRSAINTVIFLGGSQGAAAINDFAMGIAKRLNDAGIKIVHQSGRKDYDRVLAFYRENSIDAVVFDFDIDMPAHLQKADLAIARAGAGTLFELTANGLPALFVPYPHAAGNHQMKNAKYLSDRGLGWCVEQSRLTPEIFDVFTDVDLSGISKTLMKLIARDGAKAIAKHIVRVQKSPFAAGKQG